MTLAPSGTTGWTVTDHEYRPVGPTHLAHDPDRAPWKSTTLCGLLVQPNWVSAAPGLFFKQRVLKPRDHGSLCEACLKASGGRGPILRRAGR